jgi:hypothetical protein
MAQGLLQPQQVTFTAAAIGEYFWATDGSGIVFVVDGGAGSEDYQLYWVPLAVSYGSSSSGGGGSGGGGSGGGGGVTVTPDPAVNLTPFKGAEMVQAVVQDPAHSKTTGCARMYVLCYHFQCSACRHHSMWASCRGRSTHVTVLCLKCEQIYQTDKQRSLLCSAMVC